MRKWGRGGKGDFKDSPIFLRYNFQKVKTKNINPKLTSLAGLKLGLCISCEC